ncbi:universal stress protein [Salinibaculum rarum]|uniref:universal stress protein n=1 Tax=Salinibaculum rarum TaxID=3058903 RepID=UPI00265FABDC|nr:universal stress protein [Salinibaculum sp. KK48]
MTRLLVGTDSTETSEQLLDYLERQIDEGDTVYVINSLVGGDETSSIDVSDGEEAIETLEESLSGHVTVESHQYIRGNAPIEDLLEAAEEFDVDEHVIGIRKRSPVGKMMFGSTAQNLLLESDIPVRCVPLVSE